jgi:putative acetyltransferase
MGFEIRDARDSDAWDLVGLVAGCWSEYPGCVLDVHGEETELLSIATSYAAAQGRFWVAEERGRVVGSIGMRPGSEPGSVMLQKLYVAAWVRRVGLGRRLVELVEREAASHGASTIELWTDTRFTAAHALYEVLGYARTGATRDLHDLSNTTEYQYRKAL